MIVLSAEFLVSATAPEGYPALGPPEVAFCGRSNVGKSSCLNTLTNRMQRPLARVSRTPGRTRLINFFDVVTVEQTRSGQRGPEHALRLADLPGYGFARGPRGDRESWKEMIEKYLVGRETLRTLVLLVDGEIGPQPSDLEMRTWGETLGRALLIVATKLDRIARTRRGAQLSKIAKFMQVPESAVIGFSAKEQFGTEELWRAMIRTAEV